jgi:hypothetical protein
VKQRGLRKRRGPENPAAAALSCAPDFCYQPASLVNREPRSRPESVTCGKVRHTPTRGYTVKQLLIMSVLIPGLCVGCGKDTSDAASKGEKPAAAKPAEAKPAEAKPAEAKPAEAKPAEAKPAEAKPAEAKPAEAKPEVLSAEDKALVPMLPALVKCGDPIWDCDSYKKLVEHATAAAGDAARKPAAYKALLRVVSTHPEGKVRQAAALVARETVGRPESLAADATIDGLWLAALLKETDDSGGAAYEIAHSLSLKSKDAAHKAALMKFAANPKGAVDGRTTLLQFAGRLAVKEAAVLAMLQAIAGNDADSKFARRAAVRGLGTASRDEATYKAAVAALLTAKLSAEPVVSKAATQELTETSTKKSLSEAIRQAATDALK